jgi:peroxiredoxin
MYNSYKHKNHNENYVKLKCKEDISSLFFMKFDTKNKKLQVTYFEQLISYFYKGFNARYCTEEIISMASEWQNVTKQRFY